MSESALPCCPPARALPPILKSQCPSAFTTKNHYRSTFENSEKKNCENLYRATFFVLRLGSLKITLVNAEESIS
jgi:hypothetical protein